MAPEVVSVNERGLPEYLGLILGIPWLYAVDAKFSICQSSILIGDRVVGEAVREVRGPQMVFCREHNLLMYPDSVISNLKTAPGSLAEKQATVEEVDDSSSESSGSSDSEDDEEEIEDAQSGFQ